jgi:Ca-activated chloride channel homolog
VLPAFDTIHFGEPRFLWLLMAPSVLAVLWIWRLARHRRDRRSFRSRRLTPVRERLSIFGGLLFWLALIGATTLVIVAMSRPTAALPLVRTAGADVVILQDGSASMHVRDVRGDRWQRSMAFLRIFGESLRWKDDRIALALFAHVAEPQIRLTRDPNTFFFFLDHLDRESPFRLEDDPTWDTNIEQGVYWGLRVVQKDEEINGPSPNAKVFVLVSDGQAWSGEIARALAQARARAIPIFVVGVGTASGGPIPQPPGMTAASTGFVQGPLHASLDRRSLEAIAAAGAGDYFELDRESDREIANRVIGAARRRAGSLGVESSARDLYWQCLLAAACLLAAGVVFVQERAELWLFAVGAGTTLLLVWSVTR